MASNEILKCEKKSVFQNQWNAKIM
jgi:hypothetical protein